MLLKVPTQLPTHLNATFIKKYLSTGDLIRARQLFDRIPNPDVQSWTLLISAYTKSDRCREAIKLYMEVEQSGRVVPDKLAILTTAKACASLGDLVTAKKLHSDALYYTHNPDLPLGNALIDMYGKCKYIEGAERVFNELSVKDVITWTSFCSCYVKCGLSSVALRIFREMSLSGIRANAMSLSSILPACSNLKCLRLGREIHGYGVKNRMQENVFVSSALVDMYSSCSTIKHAELVFSNMPRADTVSWNVIISAYLCNGEWEKAIRKFQDIRNNGVELDAATWNTVISWCVDNGKLQKGLHIVGDMLQVGCKPNQITITSLLTACTRLEDWRMGKEIHGHMVRHCFMEDLAAATALMLIYAKSGDFETSNSVFSLMPVKDTVAWNTIILVNSMHGRGEEALSLFNRMLETGVKPNSVTFTGVLSGCSHSKMIDVGLSIFHSMGKYHKVEPDKEHYSCMVDVLGRGGRLAEAYKFIQDMPIEPNAAAWGALLGACRIYKNIDLGRIAGKRLLEIEPDNPGNYVLLFNILVTAKLWEEAADIRKMMRDRGIMKVPGCSWIRVKNRIHTFVVGDQSTDQRADIYEFLGEVRRKMKLAGYYPDTGFVLQDMDGEEQEDSLCNHSEKLAVAFGILNLKGESSVRVFKNLRICGDCHETIKFIANSTGLRIIVRDSLRFHHFEKGLCSCGDFW